MNTIDDNIDKFYVKQAALMREKRWAGHIYQTPEEKRLKWNEYQRKRRKKIKEQKECQ